jgi:transposase
MKTKLMEWWEYECPECEAGVALPHPPFPTTSTCPDCGRVWDVQKLNAQGYITLQKERVPA